MAVDKSCDISEVPLFEVACCFLTFFRFRSVFGKLLAAASSDSCNCLNQDTSFGGGTM